MLVLQVLDLEEYVPVSNMTMGELGFETSLLKTQMQFSICPKADDLFGVWDFFFPIFVLDANVANE